MAKATGEFICLTDVPRASVANALQVQARTDYIAAVQCVHQAFTIAATKIAAAGGKIPEFRDTVAACRLAINHACDRFIAQINEAERLFQAGVDLQAEEEPPPQQADGVTTNV